MKRIAIYIDSRYNQGGTYQYTKSLIYALNSLSGKNFSLSLLYTDQSWETYLNSFTDADCIKINKSPFLNRLYQFFISLGLFRIVKFLAGKLDGEIKLINKLNFDSVIFPAGDTIAILVNTGVIGAIHDLMHRYERRFKESGGFFRYRFRENYYKQILLSAKAAVVDSELGKKHVEESYKKINAKIFILPYIAPDYIYLPTSGNEPVLKDPPDYSNYLFYPAQFWPHKNHSNLLKAIKILKDKGIYVNLILSGSKNREYSNLIKYVKENQLTDRVKFKGYIPDSELILLYKNALALVMPTYYGPTNIPPIEAILLGCPPIVSNIYGMPEQFENAALYFNPDDPFEIAERIELVLLNSDYRIKLVEKGEFIKSKFSQERFCKDINRMLEVIFENKL